jgi:arylsulfatase A-like enzyme
MPDVTSRLERGVTPATLGFAVCGLATYATRAMQCRSIAAAVGCALLVASAPAVGASHPNVIVVVADALRADRLGRTVRGEALMPFVDSLAGRGYVFTRAYATASCTPASVASLFTGRNVGRHGIGCRDGALAKTIPTLAAALHAHGFATGVFSAAPLFAGAEAGVDVHQHVKHEVPVPADGAFVGSAALRWLEGRKDATQPVFLYLHYVDALAPYKPPPSYVQRVTGVLEQRREQELLDMVVRVNRSYLEPSPRPPAPTEIVDLRMVYDAAVKGLDFQIGNLFEFLARKRVLDDAIVVVTGAEGEEFGEHGAAGHGRTLWETTTRVPLVLVLPRSSARVDVEEQVSLADVAPTLLELLGLPALEGADGRARVDALRRAEQPRGWEAWRWWLGSWWYGDTVYSAIPDPGAVHRDAVVRDGAKVIVGADGTSSYYDLTRDPGEGNPNALTTRARARLARALTEQR